MTWPRSALLVTPLLLALGASPAEAISGAASAAPASGLVWSACGPGTAAELKCAELAVPVDWDAPSGGTITLTLARAAATGEGEAAGTVLFNPGGPGGAGVPALSRSLPYFAGLRARMNIVTWNPRGGQSGEHLPLASCATGPAFATPEDRHEYEQAVKASARAVAACRNAAPKLFAHMDSASQARDMDAIRAALGEEKLSYLGNSYGGVLGASYARLFPQRVRAMALDSVPDQVSSLATSERLQYEGLEKVFRRFVRWCPDSAECALRGTDAEEAWQDVLKRAERAPLRGAEAAGDRRYDGDDLKALAQSMVLREANWPAFAKAIATASGGDASGFDPQGRGLPPQPSALLAVKCADGFRYDGYRAYRAAVRRSVKTSPNFSGVRENVHLACSPWTAADVSNPFARLPARGLPPLLGVAPVYEYGSVRSVTGQVHGSVTIGYDGIGHGLYVNHGDPCVIRHVDRYLIDGKLPAPGTTCPARPA
ncbi:alpha/beta fold hydrolase [Nonomuraea aurantiaca]|uniref:alpha/beta fold hydrolase n=1 Tax=Nonomuraea aurantiaca TaxID=2878562 RepID=UPI001CD9B580|nr:alpha/beta fold hydrolase [Nonomuraea aurantiaca]MCA2220106.1 alpha/beta hydrolase [Nonomuraea aurantiaca]